MSAQLWLMVILGAAAGAPARFFIDRRFVARFGIDFPRGTLAVNLAGSAILGLATGYSAAAVSGGHSQPVMMLALVGTGFCGALTTFSGFAAQILEFEYSRTELHSVRFVGVSYALVSLVAGVGLASVGYLIGS